ncbi:MAG TPA: response regulator transcription factor [Anaerolineaceae bacterium]|nr:response regulator transcription factor [Anaerolineaceae bacterium]
MVQTNEKIKIILIDHHVLFRKGLRAILNDYPSFEVVGDYSDWDEYQQKNFTADINILIVDTDFSQYTKEELRMKKNRINKTAKILALSFLNSHYDLLDALKTGVDGFLLKDEAIETLVDNLKKVHQGKFVLSEDLIEVLIRLLVEKNDFPFHNFLSKRELIVLEMLNSGFTNKQISQKLFLSENTIKTHLKHIFKKFSVNNRKKAVEKAKLWGILR